MPVPLPALAYGVILGVVAVTASPTPPYTAATKVVPVLKSSVDDAGQPIQYPRGGSPEVTMLRVRIPPGKETGWHTHPVAGFAYVLSGSLTIAMRDGRRRTFTAGQGFAESVDRVHDGKNLGTTPVDLIVVFLGRKGHPFVVKAKP